MDSEWANTPIDPSGPYSELIYHDNRFMRVGLTLGSFLCINGVLVIIQGCIGDSEQSL